MKDIHFVEEDSEEEENEIQSEESMPIDLSQNSPIGVQRMKNSFIVKTGRIKCKICNAIYTNKSNWIRHYNTIHQNNTKHKCKLCEKEFNYSFNLKRHSLTHSKTEKNSFTCEFCQKTYEVKENLKIHQHTEHENLIDLTPEGPNSRISHSIENILGITKRSNLEMEKAFGPESYSLCL